MSATDIEVMKPLYPPEGAPVRGYVCCPCKVVTKTKRGMWAHLRIVHGIKRQMGLTFPDSSENVKQQHATL